MRLVLFLSIVIAILFGVGLFASDTPHEKKPRTVLLIAKKCEICQKMLTQIRQLRLDRFFHVEDVATVYDSTPFIDVRQRINLFGSSQRIVSSTASVDMSASAISRYWSMGYRGRVPFAYSASTKKCSEGFVGIRPLLHDLFGGQDQLPCCTAP